MSKVPKAVLAHFQNGRLTQKDAVVTRKEVSIPGGKKKFLYEMAGDSGINYIGEPCEMAPDEWSVIIRNKTTGKITLMEAEAVMFRPDTSSFNSPAKAEFGTPKDQSWFEKKADLAMSFGSKRQQNAIRARKRNAATSIAGGQLFPDASGSEEEPEGADGPSTSKIVKKEETVATAEQSADSVLPTVNYAAKSPDEVYNLDELLSPQRITLMADDVKAFAAKSALQLKEEEYPQICILLAQRMPRDPAAQLKFGAYVLYLNCLVRLLRSDSRLNSLTLQAFVAFKLTESLVKWFWDSFFVAHTGKQSKMRSLPKKNRDRMYIHTIILMLATNDWSVPMSFFLGDLKMEEKKLFTYLRMIGCIVAKERGLDGNKTVLLKGPPAKPSLLTPKKFGRK